MRQLIRERVKELMQEYNCAESTARYIIGKERKGLPYKPHKNHCSEIKYEDVKDIVIEGAKNIYITGPGYAGLYYKKNLSHGKSAYISLATIIYLQHYKCNKPKGYVIDHIDNNPLNNAIENLQMITNTQNRMKDNHGRNQSNKDIPYDILCKRREMRNELVKARDEAKKRCVENKTKENLEAWHKAAKELKEFRITKI